MSFLIKSHRQSNRCMITGHIDFLFSLRALQWRDGVSNHQPHDCLLHRLFRRRSNKASKFHVTGLCAGKSPVTGELPAQRSSNAENVSIWWRHRGGNFYRWMYRMSHNVCTRFSCALYFLCGYMNCSVRIYVIYLPLLILFTSLALRQSYNCPSASDETLMDMSKRYVLPDIAHFITAHNSSYRDNVRHNIVSGYTALPRKPAAWHMGFSHRM